MKNLPERIYINIGDGCPDDADFRELSEVTWSEEKIFPDDIEYTRKFRWISIEEKLPEDGQMVVGYSKEDGDPEVWTFHKEYDGSENCFESWGCNPQFMDYWMPLPSLPNI